MLDRYINDKAVVIFTQYYVLTCTLLKKNLNFFLLYFRVGVTTLPGMLVLWFVSWNLELNYFSCLLVVTRLWRIIFYHWCCLDCINLFSTFILKFFFVANQFKLAVERYEWNKLQGKSSFFIFFVFLGVFLN